MPEHNLNRESTAALYIHIPFCLSKCDYCGFNSYPLNRYDPAAYMETLNRQIQLLAGHPLIQGMLFDTVYIGGGTPTCIETDLLLRLLSFLKKNFRLEAETEFTIEANPGSLNLEGLVRLASAGINRISLGVQSFSNRLLADIGRNHSEEDIYQGVEKIRKAGLTNLSLDLIFGLPGQSVRDFRSSLERALSLDPKHISLYELMVEEGTPLADKLAEGRLTLPDEDLVAEMAETARTVCRAKGFRQYEIANFARKNWHCRHNLHYWHNHNYLGLGAGAVSGLQGMRITSEADPEPFSARLKEGQLPVIAMEGLCRQASFRETVIMGLRMVRGVSLGELKRRFQISALNYYGGELAELMDKDLIETREGRLRLTERGLPVANQVLSRLV
ncbi:MAG: radical SAM family heme chaperone HemW [Desulfurivibrionaceae bacterium]